MEAVPVTLREHPGLPVQGRQFEAVRRISASRDRALVGQEPSYAKRCFP